LPRSPSRCPGCAPIWKSSRTAIWDGNGGEAVRLDGAVVGSTASVAYGHTVGKVLAFAYVKPMPPNPERQLEVFMNETWRPARVLGEAAYDPAGLLPRTDAPACEAAQ
jgi:dimethylglycine dehydrogenase